MPEAANYGILAMVPLTITLVLAFWKKDAVFALFIGCIAGVMILGMDPAFADPGLYRNYDRLLYEGRSGQSLC